MLRVCGITYSHSPNYGSCLQTYALQNAVEKIQIGGGSCIYRVIPVQMCNDYPVNGFTGHIANVLMAWNRLQYKAFYKKYMKYIECSSIKELPRLNERFDVFVCGSDVIWNDSFNRHVGAYYLDFADKYRFSYAASFGKANFQDSYYTFVGNKIDRLDAISVREPSAVMIARKCTQKTVKVVADPVLLLERTEWEQIAENPTIKKPYIFVYATHLNETIKRFLIKLQEVTGLRIIWAVAGPKQAIRQHIFKVQTPEEWLGLLHDAEYVVTNSFHATAFSVLFHKKFFTVVNGEKDKGINVRMNDFLNTVGLPDRIFSDIPKQLDLSEINFTFANEKIEEMRKESMQFLQENLEAAYQQKLEREKQG